MDRIGCTPERAMRRSACIRTEPSWRALAASLRDRQAFRCVYVVGAVDTGKTTLCRYLRRVLSRYGPVAYLSADPGQSTVGPPATVGLSLCAKRHHTRWLRFLGVTSPARCTPRMLNAVRELARLARRRGARWLLVDSCGFAIGKKGRAYQRRMIARLRPHEVVAIQRKDELEPLLRNLSEARRARLHRLTVARYVAVRNRVMRRRYREERFRAYFRSAHEVVLRVNRLRGVPLDAEEVSKRHSNDRLAALVDRQGNARILVLLLGPGPTPNTVRCLAPRFRPRGPMSLVCGCLRLDRAGHEIHTETSAATTRNG